MSCTVYDAGFPSSLGTLTLKLYTKAGVLSNGAGGDAAAEDSARLGYYAWSVAEALSGAYDAIVTTSGGIKVGAGEVNVQNDDGSYPITAPQVIISGTGARTVDITVNDGTDPLEDAAVRLTKGAATYRADTDVSGECSFSVDDGTYTVSITLVGYSFTPVSLVVDGNETQVYSLDLIIIPASTAPQSVTVYGEVYDEEGVLDVGASVSMQMLYPPANGVQDSSIRTETANGDGLVYFTNCFIGATYCYWKGTAAQKPMNANTFVGADEGEGNQVLPAVVGNRAVRS